MKTEQQAKKEILESDWSVKGVKFMKGHDADSMECSLYYNTKRIAVVWDDSWGGGFRFTPTTKANQRELDMFFKFARTFTVPTEYQKDGMTYNGDIVVDVLVNDFEETRQFKRACKTKVVFTLKDEPPYSFYTMKNRYNPATVEFLNKKYGDNLKEIVNERFV